MFTNARLRGPFGLRYLPRLQPEKAVDTQCQLTGRSARAAFPARKRGWVNANLTCRVLLRQPDRSSMPHEFLADRLCLRQRVVAQGTE